MFIRPSLSCIYCLCHWYLLVTFCSYFAFVNNRTCISLQRPFHTENCPAWAMPAPNRAMWGQKNNRKLIIGIFGFCLGLFGILCGMFWVDLFNWIMKKVIVMRMCWPADSCIRLAPKANWGPRAEMEKKSLPPQLALRVGRRSRKTRWDFQLIPIAGL